MATPTNLVSANRGSRFQGFYQDQVEDTGFSNDDGLYRDSSKTNLISPSKSAPMDPRTKQIIAIVSVISFLVIGGLVVGVVYALTLQQAQVPTTLAPATTTSPSTVQYIGQSCNKSSECIASAYCDSTTAVCSCSPELYYESVSGTCRPRKGFGESCSTSSECEFNMLLMCSSSTCQCDSMLFWNPYTHRCEDKRGLGESCVGASNECYSSRMVCSPINGSESYRCLCPLATSFFSFFTGDCETKKVYGAVCYATFECIDYAWCTPFPGDTTNRCNCIPSYYYSTAASACLPKKGYLSQCTNSFECIDNMLSLQCISNKCDCPTNAAWNGTACDFLKPYGGICNKTIDCLNPGTVCSWLAEQNTYACLCPSGTYFSLVNNSCISYKGLGDICADTSECINNATCLWQSSTSDMRCQCTISNYYQNSLTSCLLLKNVNESCTSSAQCQIRNGLFCVSGRCQCSSKYYWNGVECVTKKDYVAGSSYAQYCQFNYECRDIVGLTNCFAGNCRCVPTKSWNGTNCN